MDFKNYIKAKMPWTRSIYRKRKAPFNLIHNIIDKPVVILLYHRINNVNYDLINWIERNKYRIIQLDSVIGISGSKRKEVLIVNYG